MPQQFAVATAVITGMTKQTINRHIALGDDLERLRPDYGQRAQS